MEIITVNQTILKASEGHKLTNGTAYGSSVVLGAGDSLDNWYEITLEEYNKIMNEQEGENMICQT